MWTSESQIKLSYCTRVIPDSSDPRFTTSTHRNKVVLHIGPMKGILGIPDPEKVRGIVEDPMPQDQAQLRSFRGSITYLTQYVPNLAIVIASLRKLTQRGYRGSGQQQRE